MQETFSVQSVSRSSREHRRVDATAVLYRKSRVFTFPSGAFAAPRCIWDEVSQDLGVDVPQHLRILPYRAMFDIESLLTKENLPADTNTTSYENRHTLLSVSVCSNVPGFRKPLSFVVEDSALECIRQIRFLSRKHIGAGRKAES